MRARQSSQSIAARSSSANFALAQPVRTARDPGLSKDTAWSRSPPRRPWPGRARAQPAHSHTALRCAPGDGRPHGPAWPAARRPKGPRRSPGALAHSKRGRREASAGAAILRPRRPPCRAPGPRGVRPPGGRSRIIGWFGRVCVSNGILGSRDPGRFFEIRQNRIYKCANRCCCFAVFLGG